MSAPSSPARSHVTEPLLDDPSIDATLLASPVSTPTRTVAIIKHHALASRFEIEQRLSEAGFEIVKERQMEFDVETDPDTLFELFGPDFESFAEGPVWVYVLERRRAVEVWHSLMGDADPAVAQRETPHAIRALYGLSAAQNAVMGSPDAQTAEVQIMALFASSPPFPTTELPDVGPGSMRSVSSSVLERFAAEAGAASTPRRRTGNGASTGKGSGFVARTLPATHLLPDIVPRMSKAAALRAGIAYEGPKRVAPTKERLAETFANVPGHKRSGTITVASTAPPAVAPRMTRAASLRLGSSPRRRSAAVARGGRAGHKRRESIAVASTRPPSVAPRLNKSAALRAQKEAAPPSSYMCAYHLRFSVHVFKSPTSTSTAPSRSSSRQSLAARRPHAQASRASLRGSLQPVQLPHRTLAHCRAKEGGGPAKPRPRPAACRRRRCPEANKSALLRAAKMAAQNLVQGKAKGPVGSAPARSAHDSPRYATAARTTRP
ncbi:uncharacterized protein BXZ73DRAFT_91547 [Epithele typhae]|uniref:uncharacterized protein n=1 Tax=Epithele typhae TaxID=378194 RepID=UPI002008146E|nr:uncharacterized protein BXZ73DRAFT_91547 [Epithele typhae]KAH9922832.1 hypothetical protein BXZ73DRAFT_91547 [Epithele typhae]